MGYSPVTMASKVDQKVVGGEERAPLTRLNVMDLGSADWTSAGHSWHETTGFARFPSYPPRAALCCRSQSAYTVDAQGSMGYMTKSRRVDRWTKLKKVEARRD
ncbi:hypothetical protein N7468_006030 [Penicillium chermesinum]|uniref:Uncharacterized protein n=1 Tax=Penicillium chermesinum TaxID=63820 RepID=A0A9W9P051_9EURO|nr:uncharacterized protein N7468_006030 [Penicillium chermesinum]KAJ5233074.1 hypothetical protein N7468_006030 [Penicillium chermesinum]